MNDHGSFEGQRDEPRLAPFSRIFLPAGCHCRSAHALPPERASLPQPWSWQNRPSLNAASRRVAPVDLWGNEPFRLVLEDRGGHDAGGGVESPVLLLLEFDIVLRGELRHIVPGGGVSIKSESSIGLYGVFVSWVNGLWSGRGRTPPMAIRTGCRYLRRPPPRYPRRSVRFDFGLGDPCPPSVRRPPRDRRNRKRRDSHPRPP